MFVRWKKNQSEMHRPRWLVAASFAAVILVGTLLLSLPISNSHRQWLNPLDALFTATSATCVTGLVVCDTGTDFSIFGQLVILTMIQLGGLGIMTLSTFLLVMLGRRLTVRNESILMESFGTGGVKGLKSLLVMTLLFAGLSELAGAALLSRRFMAHGYPAAKAIYHGVFHAVSAFCNAGFSLYADSLTGLRAEWGSMLTIMALIVFGGLGFLVVYDLLRLRPWHSNPKTRGRLTLHSRIVLTATVVLLLIPWVLFLALEWNHSLTGLPFSQKVLDSLFFAVTPRTAGFNVVVRGEMAAPSQLLSMLLMFVGGSPGSTAGGVKTSTILILLLTVIAMIRGREDTECFGRTVPTAAVREATVICFLSFCLVFAAFGIMLITEHTQPEPSSFSGFDLLFETVSAFGTVGLSTGATGHLSSVGRVCIIVLMFIGRLGPLTMALVVGSRDVTQNIHYPEEPVVVG